MCGRSEGETLLLRNVQLSKEEIVRRTTLMFVAMAAALVLGSGVALAALVEGNNSANTLTGTNSADTIRAYGGNDLVWALSGSDRVYGGYGADQLYGNRYGDTIFGGKGTDRLYGGYGNDHIVSRDLNSRGIGQRDVVDCGLGYDTFAADFEDRVLSNCEEGSVGGF
jgi:Ca2+-binding RTX toxin-like protein